MFAGFNLPVFVPCSGLMEGSGIFTGPGAGIREILARWKWWKVIKAVDCLILKNSTMTRLNQSAGSTWSCVIAFCLITIPWCGRLSIRVCLWCGHSGYTILTIQKQPGVGTNISGEKIFWSLLWLKKEPPAEQFISPLASGMTSGQIAGKWEVRL